MFAQVAVPLPLGSLTYKVPPGLALAPGRPVWASIRKKLLSGVVLSLHESPPASAGSYELKEIGGISDEFPELSDDLRTALLEPLAG